MKATNLIGFHRMLINDTGRMTAYRDAIFATVRPGDVVLDIGSGSGILGLFAAQAGAGHVHCVEREPIIRVARELAAANGLGDRMSFHPCDIRALALDAPVDVIQSELIGKAALGQNMAELVGWSRDRFLRPGGAILPLRVTMLAAPVEAPRLDAGLRLPEPARYDLDFAALADRAAGAPVSTRLDPGDLICAGQIAYRYDAATAPLTDRFDTRLRFEASEARILHGLTIWFEAELAPGILLGNAPPGTPSWDHCFFPLLQPVPLLPGDAIDLRIAARDDRDMAWLWRWDTRVLRGTAEIVKYRQSTFASALAERELVSAAA